MVQKIENTMSTQIKYSYIENKTHKEPVNISEANIHILYTRILQELKISYIHTFSSLINHVMCGGGLAGAVVQLASRISPISYVSLLKVITGSCT